MGRAAIALIAFISGLILSPILFPDGIERSINHLAEKIRADLPH
jgi:hypothetical protein